MKKLTAGFNLFQPWASEVARGKLTFLVRSIPTKKRERVAILATSGIDGIWIIRAKYTAIEKIAKIVGAIGSVEIKDCIEVKPNQLSKIQDELIRLGGKRYWNYYPKHLIPKSEKNDTIYIWILDKAKEWNKIKPVKDGGITWKLLNFKDE
jgi:hypothetical protein